VQECRPAYAKWAAPGYRNPMFPDPKALPLLDVNVNFLRRFAASIERSFPPEIGHFVNHKSSKIAALSVVPERDAVPGHLDKPMINTARTEP
jgi:hypothetical protein